MTIKSTRHHRHSIGLNATIWSNIPLALQQSIFELLYRSKRATYFKSLATAGDFNHRPLGYDGNSALRAKQTSATKRNETLKNLSRSSPRFAPLWLTFTDRKRTLTAYLACRAGVARQS